MNEIKTIEVLAPNIQRVIIDRCIKEKSLTIEYENQTYQLPIFIQLTYYCKPCKRTYNARVFSQDIIDRTGFASSIRCPIKSCGKQASLKSKSIPQEIKIS